MQQVGVILAGASVLEAQIIGEALPSDAIRISAILPDTEGILDAVRETGARVVIVPARTSASLGFSRALGTEQPEALLLLLVRRPPGRTLDLYEFRCVGRDVWKGQLAQSIYEAVSRVDATTQEGGAR